MKKNRKNKKIRIGGKVNFSLPPNNSLDREGSINNTVLKNMTNKAIAQNNLAKSVGGRRRTVSRRRVKSRRVKSIRTVSRRYKKKGGAPIIIPPQVSTGMIKNPANDATYKQLANISLTTQAQAELDKNVGKPSK